MYQGPFPEGYDGRDARVDSEVAQALLVLANMCKRQVDWGHS
jgi:hypothetical protein